MAEVEHQFRLLRFENFEVDLRSGELRKAGVKQKFGGQPFQVLTILLERPGEVVTREELQKRLWPNTFVDVDHNLNTAINRIREVLGDSAESPRFVETLPRRGYRFLAPVEGGVTAAQSVEKPPSENSRAWKRSLYYGLMLLSAAIVTVGALSLWKMVFRTPDTPRVARFIKLTNDGQAKAGPLATDGSRIYFTEVLPDGRSLIAQASVTGGAVVPLPVSLKQPQVLDLSKEGTQLLVASDQGSEGKSLWLQPVEGGSPRLAGTVLSRYSGFPGAIFSAYAAFGANGTDIVYATEHEIYSAHKDGSSPWKLLTVKGLPFGFRFSPDARIFRFTQLYFLDDTMNVMEARADGAGLRKIFEGCCGEWTPDGRYFIFQKGLHTRSDLWALPAQRSFPRQNSEAKPTQLTAGPLDYLFPLPGKDGKEIFAIGVSRQAEVIRYDSQSHKFVPYLSGISAEGLAFSRDGQWVAYTSYPDGMLWRSKVDGTERFQLTFPPMRVVMPRWSPDGKQIAFNATVPGQPWNIYMISSAGGVAQRILPSDQAQWDVDWAPDGNSLVFGFPNTPISIIDLRSRRISPLPGSNGLFSPHWSPDGKYISGTTIDSRKLLLFDVSTQKWTEVSTGVAFPIWSRDGKYLYFRYLAPSVNRIVRLRVSDRRIENVIELGSAGRVATGIHGQWFGLAPDDSPLFARDISTQEIYALEMDWP